MTTYDYTGGLALEIAEEKVKKDDVTFAVTVGEDELAGLAERFGLQAVHALSGYGVITRGKEGAYIVRGHVSADIIQTCVASLGPVAETIDDDFELWLVSQEVAERWDEESLFLDENHPDYDERDEGPIKIGEITAQTVSIFMNPYPRADGAGLDVQGPNVTANEPEVGRKNPFEVLKNMNVKG